MNRSKILRAIALTLALGIYGTAGAETLTIVIEDIREASGTIQVQVHAGKEQFNGEGSVAQFMEPAVTGSITLVAEALPPGEYAIRIMHDVNGNDELDTNFVGAPTEPFAFSNNARAMFGPAAWEDARFTLKGEVTQAISLNHQGSAAEFDG